MTCRSTHGSVESANGFRTRQQRNPEGCQRVAGGHRASGDPRITEKAIRTLEGCQNASSRQSTFESTRFQECACGARFLAPLRGARVFIVRSGGRRSAPTPGYRLATLRVAP